MYLFLVCVPYMEAGDMKEEDIISTVKNGIYAQQFTNGQVQIGAGDLHSS